MQFCFVQLMLKQGRFVLEHIPWFISVLSCSSFLMWLCPELWCDCVCNDITLSNVGYAMISGGTQVPGVWAWRPTDLAQRLWWVDSGQFMLLSAKGHGKNGVGIAQLVECLTKKPGTMLTQVRVPGVARALQKSQIIIIKILLVLGILCWISPWLDEDMSTDTWQQATWLPPTWSFSPCSAGFGQLMCSGTVCGCAHVCVGMSVHVYVYTLFVISGLLWLSQTIALIQS